MLLLPLLNGSKRLRSRLLPSVSFGTVATTRTTARKRSRRLKHDSPFLQWATEKATETTEIAKFRIPTETTESSTEMTEICRSSKGPQDIITQPLKPLSPLTLREREARLTALAPSRRKPNLLVASLGSSLTRPRSILTASPKIGTGSSLPSAASPGSRLGTSGKPSSPTT